MLRRVLTSAASCTYNCCIVSVHKSSRVNIGKQLLPVTTSVASGKYRLTVTSGKYRLTITSCYYFCYVG